MNTVKPFGEFFKKMRQKNGLTLRQFCSDHGLDPGNISKIERGLAIPNSHKILERYAILLGIEKDSSDWYEYFDFAAACSGKLPPDVMSDKELVEKLPLVFRTLRGQKMDVSKLDELAELIRRT
ncbi:MAG: helix-turn-helix transcriptional regulator [Deltaproteobacteria bacterium]|nr:helix-turn-helix transcriptional regulator [Deltaproteobacteria bacterium]